MNKQALERIDEFGEIWTTCRGVHSVKGKSLNWGVEVDAKCMTNPLRDFITQELDLARKEERERIIKLIKSKDLHLGYANDIIDLINSHGII